jgi:putative SOS response-associated peptidase YedK
MCGRTSLFVPQSVLEDQFGATAVEPITPRYNIAPGDELATIQNNAPDEIDLLEWGLLPSWVDDPSSSPKPINARAETVAEKPMFRDAFEERRCLILADGFYEWKGRRGSKQPVVSQSPLEFSSN